MSEVFAHLYHNTSAELIAIESKKDALISLIKVTKTINRLLASIEAVSNLTESTFQLPPAMKKFYRGIYGKFKHDPASIINSNLSEIEQRIRQDMSGIIKLTELSEIEFMQFIEASGEIGSNNKIKSILKVFRRRAQTAVCLRLILKERGLPHSPITLTIPEKQIRSSIKRLDVREKKCVSCVRENIEEFVKTIDVFFIDGQADGEVLEYLGAIRKGLIQNLKHLASGKCISEIPFPFEQVELEDDEKTDKTKADKKQKKAEQIAPVKTNNKSSDKIPMMPSQPKQEVRVGFFRRIWVWLNSPLKAGWQEDD